MPCVSRRIIPTLLGLRGDLAFQRGAYADAAADYRRQFETAPDNVAARLALAEALIAAGDRAQANALLDAFLAERPGNGPANYLRAAAAFQEGDAEAVQEHSERAVHAMPTHVPSMFLLGAGSYALGRLEYARANFEKVLARQPIMRPRSGCSPRPISSSPWPSGTRSTCARRRALFRVDLAAVQGVAPEQNWPARPEGAEAPASLARAITTAAAEILAELESAAPDSPALLELRGGLALLAGRPSAAACVRGSSARAAGGRAGAQARVRAVAGRSARHQPGDARSLAGPRARRSRDPADLADLHLAAGRTAAARQLPDQVIAARPDEVAALNNLAWALLDEGQVAAARPFAERALRLAPDEPSVMDTLACILMELGELEPAIELLQRAARVENRGPEIQVHLAQALARRGDRDEARGILRASGRPERLGRTRAGRGPGSAPRAGG